MTPSSPGCAHEATILAGRAHRAPGWRHARLRRTGRRVHSIRQVGVCAAPRLARPVRLVAYLSLCSLRAGSQCRVQVSPTFIECNRKIATHISRVSRHANHTPYTRKRRRTCVSAQEHATCKHTQRPPPLKVCTPHQQEIVPSRVACPMKEAPCGQRPPVGAKAPTRLRTYTTLQANMQTATTA